jgi:hypothetical protein
MAENLMRIFQVVEERGGLPARLKLVQMTGLTQQQAGEVKDKASLLKQVKRAASEILAVDINELLR